MAVTGLVFQELVERLANDVIAGTEPPRIEPLIDDANGRHEGVVLESSWERIVVSYLEAPTLELADVSHLRRVMARVQARRALLYIAPETAVAQPVALLATLSKVRLIRVANA